MNVYYPIITFDSNNNMALVAFRDNSQSGYGRSKIISGSGTTATAGGLTTYRSASSSPVAITFDNELAQAEGLPVKRIQIFFMIMTAGIVALSIKIVGILLLTSLMIIPVSAARKFCRTPEQMAITGSIFGIFSVWLGLETSYYFDTPSGPSIVMIAVIFFIISSILPSKEFK